METAISQAMLLRDQVQPLDHTTLGTIMQYSRSVSDLAPLDGDIPDWQVRAKCPELFRKLVGLSRAMESVDP